MAVMNSLVLAGSMFPFIFGTLSFSFIIAAFATRDWAHQDHFDPKFGPKNWSTPIYSVPRSPFTVCSVNTSHPVPNTTQFDLHCWRFRPYGLGQTSCQTPFEAKAFTNVTGDYRMCQQVHFAGNLMVAALVFTSIAFALCLPLSYYFVTRAVEVEERAEERESSASNTAGDNNEHHHPKARRHCHRHHSFFIAAATYSLIFALAIAALCTLLAQFYGILGLIMSQPDNGMFASYTLGAALINNLSGDVSHGPWVQGDGLTIFTSLGWFFSALAAGAIGGSWLGILRSR